MSEAKGFVVLRLIDGLAEGRDEEGRGDIGNHLSGDDEAKRRTKPKPNCQFS